MINQLNKIGTLNNTIELISQKLTRDMGYCSPICYLGNEIWESVEYEVDFWAGGGKGEN